jgi:phage shock protein A
MDDTQLQNALDELLRLAAKSDSRLDSVEQRLASMEGSMATMATKKDVTELVHTVTHYGKYVEGMLNAFAKTSLSHEEQLEDLRQRVAALEKRLPPQAA